MHVIQNQYNTTTRTLFDVFLSRKINKDQKNLKVVYSRHKRKQLRNTNYKHNIMHMHNRN